MNRKLFIAPFAALTLGLAACGGGSSDEQPAAGGNGQAAAAQPADSGGARVTIKAFNFQPDPLTVKAGTTVTFVNSDQIHHTATAGTRDKPAPKEFNAKLDGASGPGETTEAEVTFDKPGTYAYFCKFHPGDGMVGEIVVE